MRIFNLSNKSGSLTSSDKFVLDNGTNVMKIDYNALAKAIIEQYTGSTLAGSAQSVKAALDALNSKTLASLGTSIPVNSNLNGYTSPGRYYAGDTTGITNVPVANATAIDLLVFPRASAGRTWQICFIYRTSPSVYIRAMKSASEFTDWIQVA